MANFRLFAGELQMAADDDEQPVRTTSRSGRYATAGLADF